MPAGRPTKWTYTEIQFLRQYRHEYSITQLANNLHKSSSTIRRKLYELHEFRTGSLTKRQISDIIDEYSSEKGPFIVLIDDNLMLLKIFDIKELQKYEKFAVLFIKSCKKSELEQQYMYYKNGLKTHL